MKRILLLLFTLFLLLSSCVTKKRISQVSENRIQTTSLHDSAVYSKIETLTDTQFIIKPDSATIRALIECDQKGRAYLKQIISLTTGRKIKQNIGIKNNILTVRATIDSQAVYFQYKKIHEREFVQQKDETTEKTVQKTVIKKTTRRAPAWFWLIIAAAAAFLFWKYILPLIRPFL